MSPPTRSGPREAKVDDATDAEAALKSRDDIEEGRSRLIDVGPRRRMLLPMPADGSVVQPSSWRLFLLVAGALAGGALVLRLLHGTGLPEVQNFLLVTSSLLIEAFPFILLGAVVGAFIETFVSPRLFERGASLPRPLQLPLAGLGGFAFPVCECGSVPVARRLILKGLSPHAGITFMLAVPILNPIVLWSTAVAYRGSSMVRMVVGRGLLGFLVAVAVGWVVGRQIDPKALSGADPSRADRDCQDGSHCVHTEHHVSETPRLGRFMGQVSADFLI
jgi:uncharacterized membrane protein YraQ (UPF0718 family)